MNRLRVRVIFIKIWLNGDSKLKGPGGATHKKTWADSDNYRPYILRALDTGQHVDITPVN